MTASTYSRVVLATAFLALLLGAWFTGLSGTGTPVSFPAHSSVGFAAVALAAIQIITSRRAGAGPFRWSIAALALLLADAVTGGATRAPLPVPVAILHACLAPLAITALAIVVASFSGRASSLSTGGGAIRLSPSIRGAAWAAPPVAVLQIVFGAAYRHKVWGVLPHMGGALVLALLAIVASAAIVQRIQENSQLKSASVTVLTAVLSQVALGIAAFVMRLLDVDGTPLFNAVASLHVATGSAVLASTTVLAWRLQKIAFGLSQ